MADFYGAGILLLTLGGWIWLVGWILAEQKERRDATENSMVWARSNERAIIRAKVEALRAKVKVVEGVERPSASEGALIAYNMTLAIIDGRNDE